MYEQDDDDLDAAIYGQPAGATSPQPMTGTPTSPAPMTGLASSPATSSPQPAAPAQPPQSPTQSTSMGGDIFSSVYGQQPQAGANLADYAQQQTTQPDQKLSTSPLQPSGDRTAHYTDAVARLTQATDPTTQARERDSLSRQLATDFQAAGHDVSWDGDVMVVDGRRYTVGGATGNTTPGGIELPNDFPHAGPLVDSQAPAPSGGAPFASEGFEASKRGKQDPKYIFQAIAEQYNWNDPAQREAALQALRADPSGYFANASLNGDILDTGSNDPIYNGITRFDIQRDTENGGPLQWAPVDQGGGAAGGPGVMGVDTPGAAGVTLGTPGTGVAAPPPPSGFTPTGPTYTPGAITDDDIPDFTTDELAAQMGGYTPGRYEVGDLGVGEAEGDVDALMRSILQHPESLDAATVERMKVAGREEQADMERGDMDEMTALGYETGNESAPWLASQRLARRGQTSEAISRNNRNVDIEAARTNAGDRRAAAALGSSHLAEVGTRKRGNEALRQSGSQMNESNAFNAAKLKSDNVTSAAKLSLDAAAQRGDRMALRESVNQAAAELGISKDKLMLDYNLATMDDLTKRYGINVEAELKREGFSIDRAQLSQAGSQFHEELAFKMRQLAQQYEVDMTGIGLGYDTLEQRANEADQGALEKAIYG